MFAIEIGRIECLPVVTGGANSHFLLPLPARRPCRVFSLSKPLSRPPPTARSMNRMARMPASAVYRRILLNRLLGEIEELIARACSARCRSNHSARKNFPGALQDRFRHVQGPLHGLLDLLAGADLQLGVDLVRIGDERRILAHGGKAVT